MTIRIVIMEVTEGPETTRIPRQSIARLQKSPGRRIPVRVLLRGNGHFADSCLATAYGKKHKRKAYRL
jgi:hypothetical protein